MPSRLYTTSQHYAERYTIESERPATPRTRVNVRRLVEARNSPLTPQLDAAALTTAQRLNAKALFSGLNVKGNRRDDPG